MLISVLVLFACMGILSADQSTYGSGKSFKGIDRPFGGKVESILIRSILVNWRLGYFFYFILKGPSSQDQQKTIRRRLITFKVTLTGQSHFMWIFVLRKVTLCDYTNSVQ
jgi:hypothetical protein